MSRHVQEDGYRSEHNLLVGDRSIAGLEETQEEVGKTDGSEVEGRLIGPTGVAGVPWLRREADGLTQPEADLTGETGRDF